MPSVCGCRGPTSYLHKYSVEVPVKMVCRSTTATDSQRPQPHNHHLQLIVVEVLSYLHATYLSGSFCKNGLLVHDSDRLQPQSHLHVTLIMVEESV